MNIIFFLKVFLITVISLWLLVLIYERLFIIGRVYSGKKTTYIKDGVFSVPNLEPPHKSYKDILKWNFETNEHSSWNEPYTSETITLSPFDTEAYKVRGTFVNHSTVLLETAEYTFVTDPIYSQRVSPFSFMGPKRHHDPYVALSSLEKLDYVLISHAHYDHLSKESIEMIEEKFSPLYITPLNNGQLIARAGVPTTRIVELDLFETYKNETATFAVTLDKAKHWTALGFSDRKRYLWGSFIIETAGRRLFFAGDTGYDAHFAEIKKRYGYFDLALLPIGAYEPRWFMADYHMNPEEAVHAGNDLGAPSTMGIHFGTFKITDEHRHDPERHTKEVLEQTQYPNLFLVPTIQNGLQIEVK